MVTWFTYIYTLEHAFPLAWTWIFRRHQLSSIVQPLSKNQKLDRLSLLSRGQRWEVLGETWVTRLHALTLVLNLIDTFLSLFHNFFSLILGRCDFLFEIRPWCWPIHQFGRHVDQVHNRKHLWKHCEWEYRTFFHKHYGHTFWSRYQYCQPLSISVTSGAS